MTCDANNSSAAITLCLHRCPDTNNDEFDSHYGPEPASMARAHVRQILDEAMRIEPDWQKLDLDAAGDYVEAVIRDRHPELSKNALVAIGNKSRLMR